MTTIATVEGLEASGHHERRIAQLPRKVKIGGGIIGAFVLVALFAPIIAPHDPNAQDVAVRLQGPSSDHLFGTDALGRDVLSRLVYATRVDLPIAVLAVLLPALIGTIAGSIAGYRGGWMDSALMGIAGVVQAFPIYVFLIALVFALGSGIGSLLIAFTVINWVIYARLIRGEILRVKTLDYVQAAAAAGIPGPRVLVRHILPNAVKQTYIYMSSDVVLAMIGIATLSYFGLGVEAPTAEWGSMVAAGQDYLRTEPYLSVLPGLAIMTLGIGFALLGDGLDDFLNR